MLLLLLLLKCVLGWTGAKTRNEMKKAPVDGVEHRFTSRQYSTVELDPKWTAKQAEEQFHKMVQTDHATCPIKRRVGREGDGGWDICLTPDIRPTKPCLVYSFGVNNIWEFDDQMASEYGCEVSCLTDPFAQHCSLAGLQVLAFDPSMQLPTHKRKRATHVLQERSCWRE